MELWTTGAAAPRATMKLAQEVEAGGWDGLAVVDSQNLSGDPYVALAMAATVTNRIGLATAVTNSVTRHAAATATAANPYVNNRSLSAPEIRAPMTAPDDATSSVVTPRR